MDIIESTLWIYDRLQELEQVKAQLAAIKPSDERKERLKPMDEQETEELIPYEEELKAMSDDELFKEKEEHDLYDGMAIRREIQKRMINLKAKYEELERIWQLW